MYLNNFYTNYIIGLEVFSKLKNGRKKNSSKNGRKKWAMVCLLKLDEFRAYIRIPIESVSSAKHFLIDFWNLI